MHDVEAAGLLYFVRLQMADKVPPNWKVGGLVDLRKRLLHLVFAEVDLTGVGGGPHVVGGGGFGDGKGADAGGVAPCPAGRALDASADVGQPGTDGGGVDHYFFSVPRIPFAVAAFGPGGA